MSKSQSAKMTARLSDWRRTIERIRLLAKGAPERLADYYLESRDGAYWHPESRCKACAVKRAEADGRDPATVVFAQHGDRRTDSLETCSDCDESIGALLTEEGCDEEVQHWEEFGGPPATAPQWGEVLVLAQSIDEEDDERRDRVEAILAKAEAVQ